MATRKAIFLTHPHLLHSEITGGVQLCSQEFHHIIENISEISLADYYVPYTRNIMQRVMMKLGMENYSMYDVKKDAPALLAYVEKENIEIVFLNMASVVRYAKPLKERFGDKVKVIMLSHGNHSGDFLHLITKPLNKQSALRRALNKIRLGWLIATEAIYRVSYLDGVVTLSETEKQIENWFGGKRVEFLPRRLYADFLPYAPVAGRVGFVGRLDHPPNLQGVSILFDALQKMDHSKLEIRIVGAPDNYGQQLQRKYPFIKYLGELPDKTLEEEIKTWAVLLNPVWWYSTGASTKLARAISWGVPIISTTAGMRGYEWKQGSLIVADTPEEMARQLIINAPDAEKVQYWAAQTRIIANNGPEIESLGNQIRTLYK
jgi:glycosyltransferase involved in cell wall biosynthesis